MVTTAASFVVSSFDEDIKALVEGQVGEQNAIDLICTNLKGRTKDAILLYFADAIERSYKDQSARYGASLKLRALTHSTRQHTEPNYAADKPDLFARGEEAKKKVLHTLTLPRNAGMKLKLSNGVLYVDATIEDLKVELAYRKTRAATANLHVARLTQWISLMERRKVKKLGDLSEDEIDFSGMED
jgi:hypothetical protein